MAVPSPSSSSSSSSSSAVADDDRDRNLDGDTQLHAQHQQQVQPLRAALRRIDACRDGGTLDLAGLRLRRADADPVARSVPRAGGAAPTAAPTAPHATHAAPAVRALDLSANPALGPVLPAPVLLLAAQLPLRELRADGCALAALPWEPRSPRTLEGATDHDEHHDDRPDRHDHNDDHDTCDKRDNRDGHGKHDVHDKRDDHDSQSYQDTVAFASSTALSVHIDGRSALDALAELRVLSARDNNLHVLALGSGAMPAHLTHLSLSNNRIRELHASSHPSSTGAHSELETLLLDRNCLSSIPSAVLAALPALRTLDLARNNLTDASLPTDFATFCPALQHLCLAGNGLAALPASLPRTLLVLDVAENVIAYIADENAAALPPFLRRLCLDGNRLLRTVAAGARASLRRISDVSVMDCPALSGDRAFSPAFGTNGAIGNGHRLVCGNGPDQEPTQGDTRSSAASPVSTISSSPSSTPSPPVTVLPGSHVPSLVVSSSLCAAAITAHVADLESSKHALLSAVESLKVVKNAEKAQRHALERRLTLAEARVGELSAQLVPEGVKYHGIEDHQVHEDDSRTQYPDGSPSTLDAFPSTPSGCHVVRRGFPSGVTSKCRDDGGTLMNESATEFAVTKHELDELALERDDLCQQLAVLRSAIAGREDEISRYRERIADTEQQLAEARRHCSELVHELHRVRSDFEAADRRAEVLDVGTRELNTQILESQSHSVSLDRELTSCRDRLKERETELDTARAAELSARITARESRTKLEGVTSRNAVQEDLIAKLASDLSKENCARVEVESILAVLQKELRHERDCRASNTMRLDAAQEHIRELANERETLEIEVRRLRSEIATTEIELASMQRAALSDQEKLKSLERDVAANAEASQHVCRLRERVCTLEELLAIAESSAQDTRCEYRDDANLEGVGSSLTVNSVSEWRLANLCVDGNCASTKMAAGIRAANANLKNKETLIAELTVQCAEKVKEMSELMRSQKESEERIAGLERELKIANTEAHAAKQSAQCIGAEADSLKRDNSALKESRDAAVRNVTEQTAYLDKALRESCSHASVSQALTDKLGKLQADNTAMEEELMSTRALLLFAQDEISRLEIERTEALSPQFALQRTFSEPASSVSSEPVEMTASVSLQRIRELEDSLAVAKVDASQRVMEVKHLTASEKEKGREIEVLSKVHEELKHSLIMSEQARRESEESNRTKEDVISSLKSRLSFLSREAADRARLIEQDLTPSLEAAKKDIRLKASQNSAVVMEMAELRATADKTRTLMKQEVSISAEKLEFVTSELQYTQELLQGAEERCSSLDSECLQTRREVAMRDSRIEDLENDLAHRCGALEALHAQLVKVEAIQASSDQKAVDAARDLECVQAELAVTRDRLSGMEARCERQDKDIAHGELLRAAADVCVETLSVKLFEAQEDLAAKRREERELQGALKTKADALNAQASLCARKEREFESAVQAMNATLSNRAGEITLLKTEAGSMRRRCNQVAEELESTENALSATKISLQERSTSLRDCQSNVKDLECRLQEKQNECSGLHLSVNSRLAEIDAKDNRISTLSRAMAELEGKLAGLRSERVAGERLVDDLHSRITVLNSECQAHSERVVTLEQALQSATEKVHATDTELSERLNQLDALKASVALVEADLLQARKDHRGTRQNLEEARRQSASMAEMKADLERQLTTLESHMEGHDTLVQEYQVLNETIGVQKIEIQALHGDISMLADEKSGLESKLLEKTALLDDNIAAITRLGVAKADVDAKLTQIADSHRNLELDLVKAMDAVAVAETAARQESVRRAKEIEHMQLLLEERSNVSAEESLRNRTELVELKETLYKTQAELEVNRGILRNAEADLETAQDQVLNQHQVIEQLRREVVEKEAVLSNNSKRGSGERVESFSSEAATELCCKLESKERALANLHNWCCFLNRKLHAAERALVDRESELEALSKAMTVFSVDEPDNGANPADDRSDKCFDVKVRDGLELTTASSQATCLLRELRRSEAEVALLKDSLNAWKRKCDELQPLADSALDVKSTVESLQAQLSLIEKESTQRIDFMSELLESCKADRDAAERECAAAVGDIAALRSRMLGTRTSLSSSSLLAYSMGGNSSTASSDASLCRVTFTLDGVCPFPANSSIYVLGSDAMLGGWSLDKRLELRAAQSDAGELVRRCQVFLAPNTTVEYKFLAGHADGSIIWESGSNRILGVESGGTCAHVQAQWRASVTN